MAVSGNAPRYVYAAIFLLLFVCAVRVIVIQTLPLTGDEAYYWQWSRHLAPGYHDHPPLVGWLIRAGSIFGRSPFWVRFPSVILSFLSGIFFFLFSKSILQDAKKAFESLCLFAFIPIFSICALAIFPDAPLVFSWSFFLWSAWKWRADDRYWPLMGLAIGLGALSKLMGLFLLPSLLLYIAVSKEERKLLKRPSFYFAVLLALFMILPFLYWNDNHHFETFTYQLRQRVARKFAFSPGQFFNYAGLQLVSLSPFLFIFVIGASVMLFKKWRQDHRAAFLLAMALPIHLFFLLISFFTRVGLHWALPGYLSILTAVPLWVDEVNQSGKKWMRPFFAASVGIAALISLALYSFLRLPQVFVPWISSFGIRNHDVNQGKKLDSSTIGEIFAYDDLGKRIDLDLRMPRLRQGFVFTDSYSLSSIISFYAKTDAKTLLFTSTGGEYDRWNHFDDYRGGNALYVDTKPIGAREDIDRVLHQAFKKITPLPSLEVTRGRLNAGAFYFALCTDLANPQALRPAKPW